jgi:Ca2+-binding EF-hand superfamily protein
VINDSYSVDKPPLTFFSVCRCISLQLPFSFQKFQVLKKSGGADASNKPSMVDLDAAFKLADEDKSGTVDVQEFVHLMRLIKAGKVTGLGKPGWFQKGSLEKKFKSEMATEAATQAQDDAAAAAKEAAELSEKSKKAAAKLAAAKAKAGAPPAKSKEDADEAFWRHVFSHQAGSKGFLNQKQFKTVVKKLSLHMTQDKKESAVPEPKDLDAAFTVADEDRSGGVDEEEFVNMMRVIKAGGVGGLGNGKLYSASSEKASKFKEALKKSETTAAAKKTNEMKVVYTKAAAGDELAKAEAEAVALAVSAKDAVRRAKHAEEEAAKAKAKADFVNGEGGLGVIDVPAWTSRFNNSTPVKEKGELDKNDFIGLVLQVIKKMVNRMTISSLNFFYFSVV